MTLILYIPVTEIRLATPNQKGSAGEHGTMPVAGAGNISAGLQESCGKIPCWNHIYGPLQHRL